MRSDQAFRAVDEVLFEGLSFLQAIQGGELEWGSHLRGLGLGTYLFDAVVAWAQSLKLPDALVWPISLKSVGSAESHDRAARFYRRFGIDITQRGDGPPSSDPELCVSAIKRCPSASVEIKPLTEGLSAITERALSELDNRLRATHGKEIKQLHLRIDCLYRVAAAGWGVALAVILGLAVALKLNII